MGCASSSPVTDEPRGQVQSRTGGTPAVQQQAAQSPHIAQDDAPLCALLVLARHSDSFFPAINLPIGPKLLLWRLGQKESAQQPVTDAEAARVAESLSELSAADAILASLFRSLAEVGNLRKLLMHADFSLCTSICCEPGSGRLKSRSPLADAQPEAPTGRSHSAVLWWDTELVHGAHASWQSFQ